jgi:outer membrane protein assembly factor BamB
MIANVMREEGEAYANIGAATLTVPAPSISPLSGELMTLRSQLLLAAAFLTAVCSTGRADDWPQWMGPNRDDVWKETGILDTFPAEGPKELWRIAIGGGYAGPAVAAGKVYVADKKLKEGVKDPANAFDVSKTESSERLLCLDARTGKELWKYEYDCPYTISYREGPRCTPTVSDGKVYVLGAMGDFACLDAEKGTMIWKKNFPKDYEARVQIWGFAGHPLVYKNLVIALVGGKDAVAVAFDKDTGKEIWKSLSAKDAGYCPPTLIDAGGVKQLVIWHAEAINGLNPETGKVYWTHAIKPNSGMSIMSPRQSGDLLYAGGNGGAQIVLRLIKDKPDVEVVWSQEAVPFGKKAPARGMAPINMAPFVQSGVIYGVDQAGMMRAIQPETGNRLWWTFKPVIGKDEEEDFSGAGTGTAFIVKNGDRFFLFADNGALIIAKLTPKGYEEVSRAELKLELTQRAFGRKVVWCHPAYADKCILVRNDKEIVCYSLAK